MQADFRPDKIDKKITLNVLFKNGKFVLPDGERMPDICDGALVTLRVNYRDIVDDHVKQSLKKETKTVILNAGETVYMALNTGLTESHMIAELNRLDGSRSRELKDRLNAQDVDYIERTHYEMFHKMGYRYPNELLKCDGFIEIILLEDLQIKLIGGIPHSLEKCHCYAPYLRDEAHHFISINHACTTISEHFELGRLSHSVNAFKKVFFHFDQGTLLSLGDVKEMLTNSFHFHSIKKQSYSYIDRTVNELTAYCIQGVSWAKKITILQLKITLCTLRCDELVKNYTIIMDSKQCKMSYKWFAKEFHYMMVVKQHYWNMAGVVLVNGTHSIYLFRYAQLNKKCAHACI